MSKSRNKLVRRADAKAGDRPAVGIPVHPSRIPTRSQLHGASITTTPETSFQRGHLGSASLMSRHFSERNDLIHSEERDRDERLVGTMTTQAERVRRTRHQGVHTAVDSPEPVSDERDIDDEESSLAFTRDESPELREL
jgi:hypothetical protein